MVTVSKRNIRSSLSFPDLESISAKMVSQNYVGVDFRSKLITFTTISQFNYCTQVNKNVSQVKLNTGFNKNNIQNGTTRVHFLQEIILQVFILGQFSHTRDRSSVKMQMWSTKPLILALRNI